MRLLHERPVIERQNLFLSPRDLASSVTRLHQLEKGVITMTDGDGPPGFENLPYVRLPDFTIPSSTAMFTIRQEVNRPTGASWPFGQFMFRAEKPYADSFHWYSRVKYADGTFSDWDGHRYNKISRPVGEWDFNNFASCMRTWSDASWVAEKPIVAVEWRWYNPGGYRDAGWWDIALPLLEFGPTYSTNQFVTIPARSYFDGSTSAPPGMFSKWLGAANRSVSVQYSKVTVPRDFGSGSLTRKLRWSPGSSATSVTGASGSVRGVV